MASVIARGTDFIKRQPRDWKVVVGRFAQDRFWMGMVRPYQSIYIVALGAGVIQLGLVNTIGLGVGAGMSLVAGWLTDKYGVKKVFLGSAGCAVLVPLIFGLAQNWMLIILALAIFNIGARWWHTTCSVVCANSLSNEDRATGMGLCSTTSSALGMLAPLLGGYLVILFGGIGVEGIRPLWYIQVAGYAGIFIYLATQLKGYQQRLGTPGSSLAFFKGMSETLKSGPALKRMLVVVALTWLPMNVTMVFSPLFAYDMKGANEFVLAAMVLCTTGVPVVAAIPLGRLADRIGRKKLLYIVTPLYYASILSLIYAPNTGFLILSGFLQGFLMIGILGVGAMGAEMVPMEYMGRWQGLLSFFRGALVTPIPILAGAVWNLAGAQYLFLACIAIDVLIRLPLLVSLPETLKMGRPMRIEF